MAAFTRAGPSNRAAFDVHYQRIRNDPTVTLRAVDDDNGLVGTVASFMMEGDREVSYWIDPARWGEGLASTAPGEFLRVEATRPLLARVAQHNIGSAKFSLAADSCRSVPRRRMPTASGERSSSTSISSLGSGAALSH